MNASVFFVDARRTSNKPRHIQRMPDMSNNLSVPRITKFGGTSVADFDAMRRSAEIVFSNPEVRMVVLSASARVTTLLAKLTENAEANRRGRRVEQVRRVQYGIVRRLTKTGTVRKKIDRMLHSIAEISNRKKPRRPAIFVDELISHGELMSTRLFVEVLKRDDVRTEWFDVRQIMKTDGHFGRAQPNTNTLRESTERILLPRLQKFPVVTQGFIGIESKGRTTTLGRGGSDYTASLLGEAAQANRVDIWTDVSGVYAIDPRMVPNARKIGALDFREAHKMAHFGAKVLHSSTVFPAIRNNIPVFVGSSRQPQRGGTLVVRTVLPRFRAKTLVAKQRQTLSTIHNVHVSNPHVFFSTAFSSFQTDPMSVNLAAFSSTRVSLVLDDACVRREEFERIRDAPRLSSRLGCVEVQRRWVLVSVMERRPIRCNRIGRKLSRLSRLFRTRLLCGNLDKDGMHFLVSKDGFEEFVKMLNSALF